MQVARIIQVGMKLPLFVTAEAVIELIEKQERESRAKQDWILALRGKKPSDVLGAKFHRSHLRGLRVRFQGFARDRRQFENLIKEQLNG